MIFTIIVLQLCTTIVLCIIVVLGSVFVGAKDITFEPSSPFRHMAELHSVLQSHSFSKPVLFIYSDGGPDHRLTYVNVQLSLICLFLKFNLDYLCAGRTAPHHSWRNPVERIMSILNLGLQCVGLARSEMSAEFEAIVKKCSGLAELRQQVASYKDELNDSLSPVKARLHSLFCRLQLHNKNFEIYHSATDDEMSEFWSTLLTLDSTLMEGGTYRKDNIGQHAKVVEFISHCCQCSHYTFDILKCGLSTCSICEPPRLPLSTFKMLKHIPHPMPMEDGHYLPFSEAFDISTSEEHRPTYVHTKTKAPKKQKRCLPFRGTVQHVKNANLMVQCGECNMWRLIFSRYKLDVVQRQNLQSILDNYEYSCGASLAELKLPEDYKEVEIRDHECNDPIEILYYSAKYSPICIYCATEQGYEKDEYPKCQSCIDKPTIYVKAKK